MFERIMDRATSTLIKNPTLSGLSQVTDGLYISNAFAANNGASLSAKQIACVITVSKEKLNCTSPTVEYVQVPVSDSPHACLSDSFDSMTDKIHSVKMQGGRTLLHCDAGISRSATLCLAYLMKYDSMSLLEAHVWLKSCRPIIRPNTGFWKQLISYELKLFGKNTVKMVSSPFGDIPDVYEKETRGMIPV
ncbi:dual specificity protein phosphatase 18 [Microcaecilia unicolor]|uniref:Dual specificity protein phosphatase 18 n=1 Tax=Microcaecilia unicolor TaxID=1415580 RepID=A0A6P7Z2H8_9AMPH|nr:dual specificity protein phosphatase 18 [Microcaecilia unicolor]XP_030073543.1 dual specificity protein phosphatase 18 [Microcaecilia unicolor]XP_030073544.1 dual specificity protein phosphatase 18 [Microcaecilia unicolor]XP_030073545.1 dual specificity protein phosphatase 18 [Microcaecilia unicolor]